MKRIFLIVGLGNPGLKYKNTRHNLGFMVVNEIAKQKKARFKREPKFWVSEHIQDSGQQIVLVKPRTYMNLSGEAVESAVQKYQVAISNLLLINDDVNLKFGKLRLKGKGSAGGHNGLKSVINHLNTDQFPRLRVGVGNSENVDVVEFVLSKFSRNECKMLKHVIIKATECSLQFVRVGLTEAMSAFN